MGCPEEVLNKMQGRCVCNCFPVDHCGPQAPTILADPSGLLMRKGCSCHARVVLRTCDMYLTFV